VKSCGFSCEIDPSFHSSVDPMNASEYAKLSRSWRGLRGSALDGKVDQNCHGTAQRNASKIVGVFLALFSGSSCIATQAEIKACLAGFCVGDVHATEKAIAKKLGVGVRVHRPDDVGVSRCYFDPASKLWVDFTFAGKEESRGRELRSIMLSEQQLCDSLKASLKVDIGRQLTGISIAMTEEDVLSVLGQPARIDDAKEREERKPAVADTRYSMKFGDRVYVYEKPAELGFTFVFFKNGRVRTVWHSRSE